jgi:hypothetical protein
MLENIWLSPDMRTAAPGGHDSDSLGAIISCHSTNRGFCQRSDRAPGPLVCPLLNLNIGVV